MKKLILLMLVSCSTIWAAPQTKALSKTKEGKKIENKGVPKVRVTGNRVSLRAKANAESELLDRAMRGDEFVLIGKTNGWVAVQAPDTIDFWVFGKYLKNGVVDPKKLNVRSGPNQNYSIMYVAKRDEKLQVRGEAKGWIRVAPMSGSKVWISEKFVEPILPPKPKKVVKAPVVTPKTEIKKEVKLPPKKKGMDKPIVLVLDDSKEQGVYGEIPGVLRQSSPGLYKLVLISGDIEETICLVRGNEKQLNRYLNRSLLLEGKKYWAKDVEWVILNVEKIYLNPIIKE